MTRLQLVVLHVFCQSEIGGAEAVILNLIKFRMDLDIRHTVAIVADSPEPLAGLLNEIAIEWEWIPRGRMRHPHSVIRVCWQLRSLVKKMRANVVLANMAQPYLYAYWALTGTPIPVALYQMMVPTEKFWHNNVLDILVGICRPVLTFAASRTIAARLVAFGFPNVQPVYHGTPIPSSTDSDRDEMEQCLETMGIGTSDPLILMCGRLQRWKGQHLLIEAFPAVLRKQPNAHLVFLGSAMFGIEQEYEKSLHAQVDALGLQKRVHFGGHQKVPSWLKRSTMVVHASTSADAFPNVCIEAMAAGRPLITNTSSGTAEILIHGVNAMVIKPNDVDMLSSVINRLLEEPWLARLLGTAGQQVYNLYCTPAKMVMPIESSLREISIGIGGLTPEEH